MTEHTHDQDDDLIPVEIRVKPIADELEEVRARIKDLQAREKELTLEVRATVPGDGTFGPITVSTPRNLDAEAVARATCRRFARWSVITPAETEAPTASADARSNTRANWPSDRPMRLIAI